MLEILKPGIRRLLAPNPSPMTFTGTNTYIIGNTQLAVIDPGPHIQSHLNAILDAQTETSRITKILITHSHLDHSPLARPLADATGASVLAFGDSFKGRSAMMQDLAKSQSIGGGEGVDTTFAPDVLLSDGETITVDGAALQALWTPGHFNNHMCFVYQDAMFCGDHVMGWASSLVSPPYGDLAAFMASCAKLLAHPEKTYFPGHGDVIDDGPARVRWLVDHRKLREAQILQALDRGAATAQELALMIYHDVDPALLPAAARNVLAHLLALHEDHVLGVQGTLHSTAEFYLI